MIPGSMYLLFGEGLSYPGRRGGVTIDLKRPASALTFSAAKRFSVSDRKAMQPMLIPSAAPIADRAPSNHLADTPGDHGGFSREF